MEQAHRLLPGSTDIKLLLAQGYASVGRSREAIALLRKVLAWSHGDNDEVVRLLVALEARLAANPDDDQNTE